MPQNAFLEAPVPANFAHMSILLGTQVLATPYYVQPASTYGPSV
jgi:hypothetical protein